MIGESLLLWVLEVINHVAGLRFKRGRWLCTVSFRINITVGDDSWEDCLSCSCVYIPSTDIDVVL